MVHPVHMGKYFLIFDFSFDNFFGEFLDFTALSRLFSVKNFLGPLVQQSTISYSPGMGQTIPNTTAKLTSFVLFASSFSCNEILPMSSCHPSVHLHAEFSEQLTQDLHRKI